MKVDFETAVMSAINKDFPDSIITGCNFNLKQCRCRQLQNIGLTVGYKQNQQLRLACRMRAALTHVIINKLAEDWLMIMKNITQNEKLTLFIDHSA
jgi:hypothetical protein